jgi:phosphoribosyl 1,2-cyclic phosphate phosphodiesterase
MSGAALKATILGCGSSGGVPRIGGDWGACDPSEPKNRRSRCSLLLQRGKTSVLVDTSPDMREQLLRADIGWLDGVLFTHDHADQTHGIDDLRALVINRRQRVDCYMDESTKGTLRGRFGYCFSTPEGSNYPPITNAYRIAPGKPLAIASAGGDAIEILPFLQHHGEIESLGFRFGPLAYSSDVVGLPEASFDALEGVEIWILDALRYRAHPSHAHIDLALEWIERVKPRRAILTNMHIDLDYETLRAELPAGVEPAYDGMTIECDL